MKSINSLDITRLRVEEDFGFQKRIESETALLTEETDKPMVDAFKAAVATFDAALKASTRNSQSSAAVRADEKADAARTAEESIRIVSVVKQARMDADAAFRTLAGRVNALALVNDEAPYAIFIDHVNVIIRQTQAVLTARRTRGEKDGKDDRPVIE